MLNLARMNRSVYQYCDSCRNPEAHTDTGEKMICLTCGKEKHISKTKNRARPVKANSDEARA